MKLLLLLASIFMDEYSPYVQMVTNPDQPRHYSGVVVDEDSENYYIISCAHGTQDLTNPIIATNVVNTSGASIKNASVKTTLIKEDPDIDLAYLSMPKFSWIKITPLKIADDSLVIGTKLESFGYEKSDKITRNPVVVSSYNQYRTLKGSPILACDGKTVYGLSGGPLIFENKVYGIQSSGGKNVLYCPADQVLKFIEVTNAPSKEKKR